MSKLKIRGKTILGNDVEVFLDDHKVKHVRSLTLNYQKNDITTATLEIDVAEVDFSGEILAELIALYDKKKTFGLLKKKEKKELS